MQRWSLSADEAEGYMQLVCDSSGQGLRRAKAPRDGLLSLRKLAEEIATMVAEQGAITKDEITRLWDIDDHYHDLREFVLGQPGVVSGPQRAGGFIPKRGRAAPGAEEADTRFSLTDWQELAVIRLAELLKHDQLEELLGDLHATLRSSILAETGVRRRGSKREYAVALIIQHDCDLLAEKSIREAVAKECGIKSPGSWHSGKAKAFEFVEAAGFPREFAGRPTEDRLNDYEYLEAPPPPLAELEDFQRDVSAKMLTQLNTPGGRAIVTLPTGAGKTRTAVETLRNWVSALDAGRASRSILWIAHSEELCEQACLSFRQTWQQTPQSPAVWMFRFWGAYTRDFAKHEEVLRQLREASCVVVTTPQRLVNMFEDPCEPSQRLLADLRAAIGAIVVDEAHRAAAPSYLEVFKQFCTEQETPLIGLTATPIRKEYLDDPALGTRQLAEVFQRILSPTVEEQSAARAQARLLRENLQSRGILARPVFRNLDTDFTLRGEWYASQNEDISDELLRRRADFSPRRQGILKKLLPYCQDPGNSILYFGPSVGDAEAMAFLLRKRGVRAAVVSGGSKRTTRRDIVSRFKRREIQVLCNCEVLTTGFDAPKVSHVVVARPTVSSVLYEQMIGRGLRGKRFGGTESCVILNCRDDYQHSRPRLGYEQYLEVWEPAISAAAALQGAR